MIDFKRCRILLVYFSLTVWLDSCNKSNWEGLAKLDINFWYHRESDQQRTFGTAAGLPCLLKNDIQGSDLVHWSVLRFFTFEYMHASMCVCRLNVTAFNLIVITQLSIVDFGNARGASMKICLLIMMDKHGNVTMLAFSHLCLLSCLSC